MSERTVKRFGGKKPDSSARDVQVYGVRNEIRQAAKSSMFGAMYGTSTKRFASDTSQKQFGYYKSYIVRVEAKMKQMWIINDEWSEYHQACAKQDGWALGYVGGMWQVITTNEEKYATDDIAREHVLAHEHDIDNTLYTLAVNAIIMGNMGKT